MELTGPDGTIDLEPFTLINSDIHSIDVAAHPSTDLAPGQYVFTVEVQDRNTNTGSGSRTFSVLGRRASASFAQPDGVQFVGISPYLIEGSVGGEDMLEGAIGEIFVNGDLITRATVDAETGNFTSSVPLAEGLNEIVLVTVNAIGVRSQPSAPREIALDTQAPQTDGLEPSDSTLVNNLNAIRATLEDSTVVSPIVSGVDPDSIQVMLDGAQIPPDDPNTPESDGYQYHPLSGQFIYHIPEPFDDRSTHTVRIHVADKLGNRAEAESTFTVDQSRRDRRAPVISITPPNGARLNTEALLQADFAIRAIVYDTESGLEALWIRLDGKVVNQGLTETGVIALTPAEPLTDGDHLIMIYARDKAGNEIFANSKLIVDTSTPKPLLEPLPALVNTRRIAIKGTAEPGANVAFLVNGQPAGTITVDGDGRFSRADLQLIEGRNGISATATDTSGNTNISDTLIVSVDGRPPLIGNPTPEPGSHVSEARPLISVEISDSPTGSGIDSGSSIFLDCAIVLDGNIPIPTEDFSFNDGRLTYTPTTDLAEGAHFFRVFGVDRAGNRATFNSGEFFVDFTPPPITQIVPSDGETISNPEVEISAVVEGDDVQTVLVQLFPAGDTENPIPGQIDVFETVSGRIRFRPDNVLSDGGYIAFITAEDRVGNVGEASVTFSVDTGRTDDTAPLVVPRFPDPGQEVSTTSFLAIRFEVVDPDSGIDFDTIIIEINGVVYDHDELFGNGGGVLNRETGEVTIFGRLNRQQFGGGPAGGFAFDPLELGALEDPLELGALEDPLELGALEDPLELGALEDPLELGALEDPLELGALEDPLELGALERPTDLAVGLNTISITISDNFGNFSNFSYNFDVSK